MRRLLLTGGRGFIGRHCLPLLAERFEVHATTSGTAPADSRSVMWHHVDLLDTQQVDAIVRQVRPSHLLHLAWTTAPGIYWTSETNLMWVQKALDLIRVFQHSGGQRIVIAGTCAEYEWSSQPLSEIDTPLRPSTLYGASKAGLGIIFERFCAQFNLSGAWGRLFFLYGPGEHPSRLVPSVARAILDGRIAPCSSGTQRRDFLYVEDAARAFVSILESELTGAVNIASGQATEVKEVVLSLGHLLNRRDLVHLGGLPDRMEPSVIVADVDRLTTSLGWRPRYDLDAGLRASLAWWRQHSDVPTDSVRFDEHFAP